MKKINKAEYIKIPTGLIEKGKFQTAFLAIYTKNAKPFYNYEGIPEHVKNANVPTIIMQMRTDGSIGFVGGYVNDGETVQEGLLREIIEEIGANLDVARIEPLATFMTEKVNIHSFCYEVEDLKTIMEIQAKSLTAVHNPAEHGGCFLHKIVNYDLCKGHSNFLKNQFSGTAKQELKILVKEKGLLVKLESMY
jgi:U8 snoRNA-decapping enzyme